MPASLQHIHPGTPMGANLIADGATFRVWAPHARAVHVLGDFNDRQRNDASLLTRDDAGALARIHPAARAIDSATCSTSSATAARGPSAIRTRASCRRPFPSECIIRSSDFPWHDCGYVTPPFHDFVIYQLHVGTFFTPNLPAKGGTFLDVARKIPYLAELGRDGDSADADPGISDRVQPRIQRHRLLLARNGFRGRGRRAGAVCRGGQPAARCQGAAALSSGRSARRDEPAEGARRSGHLHGLAVVLDRRLQPCRRRLRRREPLFLRSAADGRRATAIRSTSPTRDTPAGWCSTSENRKCATF